MVGGRQILTVKGDQQDDYFTVNPQVTFFKSVFRRHSRFSIETITQSFDKQEIHATNDTIISLVGNDGIKRSGDLLKSIYLTFTLPDIYSGTYSGTNDFYHFKWIRNLGFYIIKSAKLRIGGSLIQDFTGEWLDVHKELYLSDEEKESIDKMIGNTLDMTDPEKSNGNIINKTLQFEPATDENRYRISCKKYPHSKKINEGGALNILFSDGTVIKVNESGSFNEGTNFVNDRTIPTIYGRKIRVPLSFWFTKSISQALPLISLRDTPIELEITLRPINDLYTVTNVNDSGVDSGSSTYRIKNNNSSANKNTRIQHFLNDTSSNYTTSYSSTEKTLINNKININPELDLTYIFLDNDERNKFAQGNHQYLIETVKKFESTNNRNNQVTIDTNSNNHVKEILVIPKRTDAGNVNEWDNFTNWLQKGISPTSYSYWLGDSFEMNYYDTTVDRYPFPSRKYSTDAGFKPIYLKKDIIKSMDILLNKTPLFKTQTGTYFQNQQVLEYFKTSSKDGIYVYSFSLDPKNSTQPSGSLNFSHQDVNLRINFNSIPQQTSYSSGNEANYVSDYGFNVSIYLVQYNILDIQQGTCGLKFQG